MTREFTISDPADGSTVGTVLSASADDVDAAIETAAAALDSWAGTSPQERGSLLHAVADALEEAAEELAELNHRETGKTLDDSRGGVEAGIGTVRQYAELGPLHRGHSLRGDLLAADYTLTRPRGVAVALTPWNDPVAVAMGLIGAALATGNTVIHKPSERNPHLGIRLGEVIASVLPDGVFQTLSGDGAVGELLTADPRVNVIAHVGSTATGRAIARSAAETGAHVILENGGNDPLLIDRGVDVRWAAAQAALGSFANAGQICTSVERIYVHADLADEFVNALAEEAKQIDASPQPLVDAAHRDHVHSHVEAALTAGARAVTGGEVPDGPGTHYPATVLTGCTDDMEVMTEETFGPVAAVRVVDSFEEGLTLAAAGRYGLAATVLTPRIDHALESAARLHVGTIKINGVFGGAPGGSAQPHGDSGAGFGYGPELLDEMTTTSVIHMEFPTQGERS